MLQGEIMTYSCFLASQSGKQKLSLAKLPVAAADFVVATFLLHALG